MRIILIPKLNKNITGNWNYRSKSLKNIDGKILYKTLANQIQQYVKTVPYHDPERFIPGRQGWFGI